MANLGPIHPSWLGQAFVRTLDTPVGCLALRSGPLGQAPYAVLERIRTVTKIPG